MANAPAGGSYIKNIFAIIIYYSDSVVSVSPLLSPSLSLAHSVSTVKQFRIFGVDQNEHM